jgi:hypothetical protein
MLAGVGRNSASAEPFMRCNDYGQDTARRRYESMTHTEVHACNAGKQRPSPLGRNS